MKERSLPIFELKIDEKNSYVDFIALVESPAIEEKFLAFAKSEKIQFSLDDEKMELLGPAMLPDQLIYRIGEDGKEFQVFFSKDTIRQIAQAFFKNGNQFNLNIEHSAASADSYVFQSMIVDKAKGFSFKDYPDGSWVIGVKVQNESIWKDIKDGKRNGFSIEGVFQMLKSNFNSDEKEISELLDKISAAIASKKLKLEHI